MRPEHDLILILSPNYCFILHDMTAGTIADIVSMLKRFDPYAIPKIGNDGIDSINKTI